MGFPPATESVVFYAYSIRCKNKIVGKVQSLRVNAAKEISRYRGVWTNPQNLEENTVLVPGHVNYTVAVDRLETYNENVLEVFGLPGGMVDLGQMTIPVDIVEELRSPHWSLIQSIVGRGLGATASVALTRLVSSTLNQQGNPIPRNGVIITYKNCVPSGYSKTIQTGSISITESVTFEVQNVLFEPLSEDRAGNVQGTINSLLRGVVQI